MFSRYWHTLRPLKPSQLYWRARYRLAKALGLRRAPVLPTVTPGFNAHALDRLRSHLFTLPSARDAEGIRSGKLVFHHAEADVSSGMPWSDGHRGRLWQYHLHYFDYVRSLARAQQDDPQPGDSALALGWIHDWVARNPPGTDVAWDAYCVSARLMNWALAESVFRWNDATMRRSYALQTVWLLRNLEWDIRGNHLLKNAAALSVAGNLLGGDASWRGRDLLEAQVDEQVLPDGGHYERSPMYHQHVLEDLRLAHAVCDHKPVYLGNALEKMERWSRTVRHPDGGYPLFGDCALDATDAPIETGAHVSPLAESGYYIVRWGEGETLNSCLILKACGPEPAFQPGHAHADPFTFELSSGGQRMIVDTGTHGYAESPWRSYCRSARAHNVALLDGKEPMDAWGVFRVGRRYRPEVLSWSTDRHGAARFVGRHDGYAPATVEREVQVDGRGGVRIEDRAIEAGKATLESHLHLHPEVRVEAQGNGFLLTRAAARLWLLPGEGTVVRHLPASPQPPEGWYFPEFGLGFPADGFVLSPSRPGGQAVAYALIEAPSLQMARSHQMGMQADV